MSELSPKWPFHPDSEDLSVFCISAIQTISLEVCRQGELAWVRFRWQISGKITNPAPVIQKYSAIDINNRKPSRIYTSQNHEGHAAIRSILHSRVCHGSSTKSGGRAYSCQKRSMENLKSKSQVFSTTNVRKTPSSIKALNIRGDVVHPSPASPNCQNKCKR